MVARGSFSTELSNVRIPDGALGGSHTGCGTTRVVEPDDRVRPADTSGGNHMVFPLRALERIGPSVMDDETPADHPYLEWLETDADLQQRWISPKEWDRIIEVKKHEIEQELSDARSDTILIFGFLKVQFIKELIAAEAAWFDHECEHAIPVMVELVESIISALSELGIPDLFEIDDDGDNHP